MSATEIAKGWICAEFILIHKKPTQESAKRFLLKPRLAAF